MKNSVNNINWWNISTTIRLAALGIGRALFISQDACAKGVAAYLAPFKNEAEAVEKGKAIGVGSARLEGPKTAEVFTYKTWTIVYTAGKVGIKPGGRIRIGIRHMCNLWNIARIVLVWTRSLTEQPFHSYIYSISSFTCKGRQVCAFTGGNISCSDYRRSFFAFSCKPQPRGC
jgi:hypothetical protein